MFKILKTMKDNYKQVKAEAEQEEASRTFYFDVRGYRDGKTALNDYVELEHEKGNDYKVLHDDHVIGWITSPKKNQDDFDNADTLELIEKDGKVVVKFVAFE